MKFLKPFKIFEREFTQPWINNNKNFYLVQNKEMSDKTLLKNKSEGWTNNILLEIKSILKNLTIDDLDVKMTINNSSQSNWRVSIKENDELSTLINLYKESADKNFTTYIDIQVDVELNRTHTSGLPKELQGIGLGYKMYKALIKKIGYARSSLYLTNGNSMKIWYHLIQDKDLYSIILNKTNRSFSFSTHPSYETEGVMVISKLYPIDKIKELIEKCKNTFNTIELDDELKNIIK